MSDASRVQFKGRWGGPDHPTPLPWWVEVGGHPPTLSRDTLPSKTEPWAQARAEEASKLPRTKDIHHRHGGRPGEAQEERNWKRNSLFS